MVSMNRNLSRSRVTHFHQQAQHTGFYPGISGEEELEERIPALSGEPTTPMVFSPSVALVDWSHDSLYDPLLFEDHSGIHGSSQITDGYGQSQASYNAPPFPPNAYGGSDLMGIPGMTNASWGTNMVDRLYRRQQGLEDLNPPAIEITQPHPSIDMFYPDFITPARHSFRISLQAIECSEYDFSSFFLKVDQLGYNVQRPSVQGRADGDGLVAIQRGLATICKSLARGPGPTLPELSGLLLGPPNNQPLSRENLIAVLNRYGTRSQERYGLGIICLIQSSPPTYGVYVEQGKSEQPPLNGRLVWIYEEAVYTDYNSRFSRWYAIAPDNIIVANNTYADVLKSPPVQPAQLRLSPAPLPTLDLLQPPRPSTGSSRTLSESGSSSTTHTCECGKHFHKKTDLRNHQKTHSKTSDRPFKCRECGQGFLWQKDLNRHLTKHNGRKDFFCPAQGCAKKFTRRDNMVRHHDGDHPEQPPLSQKGSSRGSRR